MPTSMMRVGRRGLARLAPVSAVVIAAGVVAPAVAADSSPHRGDVRSARVQLTWDEQHGLTGHAMLTVRQRTGRLLPLQVDDLDVHRVTVDGEDVSVPDGPTITVPVDSPARVRVELDYHVPVEPTEDGAALPSGRWLPGGIDPADRTRLRASVTVPAGLQAVAPGVALAPQVDGTAVTWRWRSARTLPGSAPLAIGRFDLVADSAPDVQIRSFADPVLAAEAEPALRSTPRIVSWLTGRLGRSMPFASSGIVIDDAAADSTGAPAQGRPVFAGVPDDADLVAGLAAQWYPAAVHPEELALAGAWADYLAWQWGTEHGAAAPLPSGPGVARLHRLRDRLGDPTFWQLARDWAETRGASARQFEQMTR